MVSKVAFEHVSFKHFPCTASHKLVKKNWAAFWFSLERLKLTQLVNMIKDGLTILKPELFCYHMFF